jgi:integrase/recombinase XerD
VTDVTVTVLDPSAELRLHRLTGAPGRLPTRTPPSRSPRAPVLRSSRRSTAGRAGRCCANRWGNRISRKNVAAAVARLAREAGIARRMAPHTLWHAAITAALNAGAHLRDVQDFARHADPKTTMRYDRNRHSLDRHATYVIAQCIADSE